MGMELDILGICISTMCTSTRVSSLVLAMDMGTTFSLSILVLRIATSMLLYRIAILVSSMVVDGSTVLFLAMDRSSPIYQVLSNRLPMDLVSTPCSTPEISVRLHRL